MYQRGPESDEELAVRCQAGDYAAFEELYRRHHRPIMAYIHQIVRDGDGTACIAQDVFLRVFEHIGSFDASRRFTTWFYAIARHAAIDWLQSRRRRAMVSFDDLDPEDERVRDHPGRRSQDAVDGLLLRAESIELLVRALERLPQIYREIVELTVFQDLSYDQAGEILGGVNAGTLRSRRFHALRRLRTMIEDELGPEAFEKLS
jgi:RNA polymerase sigma-70 factor (ECF subfamily)